MNNHPKEIKAASVNRYLNGELILKIPYAMNIFRTVVNA